MIKRSKQNIIKHKIKNQITIKHELNNLILKSIIHNSNLYRKNTVLALLQLKKKYVKKNKKICFITGQNRGINPHLGLSRHNLNYFTKLGILQNFKIKSW